MTGNPAYDPDRIQHLDPPERIDFTTPFPYTEAELAGHAAIQRLVERVRAREELLARTAYWIAATRLLYNRVRGPE